MFGLYCETNECADGLAKQENHQQQVLTIYETCPTFVYLCYVRDMIGLGSNRLYTLKLAITIDVCRGEDTHKLGGPWPPTRLLKPLYNTI